MTVFPPFPFTFYQQNIMNLTICFIPLLCIYVKRILFHNKYTYVYKLDTKWILVNVTECLRDNNQLLSAMYWISVSDLKFKTLQFVQFMLVHPKSLIISLIL